MRNNNTRGALSAAAAYFIWGISPFYWKVIRHVSPVEIIMHRIIWSSVCLLVILGVFGRLREFFTLFKNRATLKLSFITALCIAINWGVFIYGVNTSHTVDVSLGYYICPLMTVFLASFVLKEKLTRGQRFSVLLATIGVVGVVLHTGVFPLIATILATSFAVYGLLRKQMKLDALMGLALETVLLFMPALLFVSYNHFSGTASFTVTNSTTDLFLMLGGVVTLVPLLFYSYGVRNAQLSTVGFLQYIGPSLQLLSAVFIFGEPFDLFSFGCFFLIWTALAVFLWDSRLQSKRQKLMAEVL